MDQDVRIGGAGVTAVSLTVDLEVSCWFVIIYLYTRPFPTSDFQDVEKLQTQRVLTSGRYHGYLMNYDRSLPEWQNNGSRASVFTLSKKR